MSDLLTQLGALALCWLIFCAGVAFVDWRSGLAAKMPCFDFPTPWPEESLLWVIPNVLYFKAKRFNLRIECVILRLKGLVLRFKLRYTLFKARRLVARKFKALAQNRADLELADDVSEQSGDVHDGEAGTEHKSGQDETASTGSPFGRLIGEEHIEAARRKGRQWYPFTKAIFPAPLNEKEGPR